MLVLSVIAALAVMSAKCSLRLYNTERLSDTDLEYDCFQYRGHEMSESNRVKSSGGFELIAYCIRPSYKSDDYPPLGEKRDKARRSSRTFTFEQLRDYYQKTAKEIYQMVRLASIDDVERYQIYLNTSNETMSQERFFQCNGDWFGTSCQYDLVEKFTLEEREILKDPLFDQEDLSNILMSEMTCYTHLSCNRGSPPACLDWREICDGTIDCGNDDGIDEKFCDELEVQECSNDEYRCHNGRQCIPKDFFHDDPLNPDCQDGSDEIVLNPKSNTYQNECYRFSGFQCEERTCKPKEFACGDGQCVNEFDKCHNRRGELFMMDATLAGHAQDVASCPSVPAGCSTHLSSVHDCSKSCWGSNIGLCRPGTGEQCTSTVFMLPPNEFKSKDNILLFYNYKRHFMKFHWILIPNSDCDNDTYCPETDTHLGNPNDGVCKRYKNQLDLMYVGSYSRTNLTATINRLLKRCHQSDDVKGDCNHSSLYRCKKTGKCISKHRLMDGIFDCQEHDDELYNDSCSLNNEYRFKCPFEEKCISHLALLNGRSECLYNADEIPVNNPSKSFSYRHICDGIQQLIDPLMINGSQETDETDCNNYDWPCNNIYTRCDGVKNCQNGTDELNCFLPQCQRGYLCFSQSNSNIECVSPHQESNGTICYIGYSYSGSNCFLNQGKLNNKITLVCFSGMNCLHLQPSICDNKVDCRHGEDEYLCGSVSSNVLEFIFYCNDINKQGTSDSLLDICYDNQGYISFATFSLWDTMFYPPIPIQNVTNHRMKYRTTKNLAPNNYIKATSVKERLYCNRGIDAYVADPLDGILFKRICFCPPSYYGSRCQYQSDRVSLTIRMRSVANQRNGFILSISLIDEKFQINSHERLHYLPSDDCDRKFDIYLLYESRAKDKMKNYSVHIDAFGQDLSYHFSWYLSVPFSFIPVTRIAALLKLPPEKSPSLTNNRCKLQCKHGQCIEYTNVQKQFCHCESGWFGLLCDMKRTCDCSPDSRCIGYVNNRPMCLCPSHKDGPRCFLNHLCDGSVCKNGGTCLPTKTDHYVDRLDTFRCVCTGEFEGITCEIDKPTISLFLSDAPKSSLMLVHFVTFSAIGPYMQSTHFLKVRDHTDMAVVHRSTEINLNFVFVAFDNLYHLVFVQKIDHRLTNIAARILSERQCFHIRALFDLKIVNLHPIKRVKHYQKPCRERANLVCFHDETYMCVCTSDRFAHCFEFNFEKDITCRYENPCENNARCFHDRPNCPSRTECICQECFHGTLCQFSTRSLGISLDAILGYQIQPFVSLLKQPLPIKVSILITTIMILSGLISGLMSLITFQASRPREFGCGNYLLASSITSILTMIVFTLKFWFLLLAQAGIIVHSTVLRANCLSMDVLIKVCLNTNNWLDASVAIERTVSTIQGISFDKKRSKRISIIVIFALILFTVLTFLPDPLHRILLKDEGDQRTWCIVRYPASIEVFNTAVLIIHQVAPFAINAVSALIIIMVTARNRLTAKHKLSYRKHLQKQIGRHKHLLISPIILVLLSVPRLVIAFLPGCMKPMQEPWLYLGGYFVSFIPPLLVFPLFVLPSTMYRKEFCDQVKRLRSATGRLCHHCQRL